jgi:hypothetical protein
LILTDTHCSIGARFQYIELEMIKLTDNQWIWLQLFSPNFSVANDNFHCNDNLYFRIAILPSTTSNYRRMAFGYNSMWAIVL